MTNILLAAGIVILLLAANIVILIIVLRRTRQRKRPYRGLFTTVDTAIRRETDKVFGALHASVPDGRAPGHWLLAEASDEHTGLLCGIAARPGPARLRIKKAVHERVKKADIRLEDTMRACLEERPCRMAVERASDKKIVLLDRRESVRYEEYRSPPEPDYTGYYADRAEELLADREPEDLWETVYDATVTAKDSRWDDDTESIIGTVVLDMQELKGLRKSFEKVHRMKFGGNPPPPHSDDRKTPVEVSVAETELAHNVIVDWVWRLAPRKSRRLNVLLWRMKRLRRATLRAFPAYADALETAATEHGASNAKAVGKWLHNLPNRVVKAMAECMTDMERNFAAMGVFACIEARVEKPHDIAAVFDWSFAGSVVCRRPRAGASSPGLRADSRQPQLPEEDGSYPRTGHGDGCHFRIRRRYLRPKAAGARCRRLPRVWSGSARIGGGHGGCRREPPVFHVPRTSPKPQVSEDGQARDVSAGGRRCSCERPMSGD